MNTSFEAVAAHVMEFNHGDFEALIGTGVTLVDFWAPWCGPCHMQTPLLEQVASRFKDRAKVAKVDVDLHPALADRFGITGIPTLLLFKKGQMIRQFVGVQSISMLIGALELALGMSGRSYQPISPNNN